MSQYLSEAFKRLDALNEDTFAINGNGLEDFEKFQEEDEFEDTIDVIDPEATTEEELQDSYVGKVILDCCVCHSKIYKDVEDVVIEDDIANATEECPFCYTTDGYKVIGQVAEFGEVENEEKDTEDEDDTLEEGLFDKFKKKNTDTQLYDVWMEFKGKKSLLVDNVKKSEADETIKDQTEGAESQVESGELKVWAEPHSEENIDNFFKNRENKSLEEAKYKKVKSDDQESTRQVKMSDIKKGDLIIVDKNDRTHTPHKVTKIEKDAKGGISLVTDNGGNVSGDADTVITVFDAVNMKSRKTDAKLYRKKGWDAFEDGLDDDGEYYATPKKENLEEASYKKVKTDDQESIRKVKMCDVKKGDLIKGNSKDRAFAPSKVIKIEDNGEYINLITKIGNVSGGREDTVDVFDAVNMKSRKADARLLQKKGWNAFDDVEDEDGDFYSVPKKESLEESVNNVNVETDEDVINVATDDSGKVTVTTEPKNTSAEVSEGEEVIAPLEPETQSEISDNVADGEEIEIDMDEFDEESFDELGEGYLKKVYENVNSFKTSNVSFIKNKLVVEGVIKFNSGKSKKTNFIFESREATKSGKVRFIGENKEIARGRKSFTITGKVDNKKFMSESLNYNYGVKGANGKAQRLYGTVRRGK